MIIKLKEESSTRRFMSADEQKLKKELIDLLRDDGNGHHHAKYAKRLSKYDVNIVPLKADPNFTAAISFDEGVIYIGEGFLIDPALRFQLNVLLRHELAHNLLMHQIRMMYKLGEDKWAHTSTSDLIHNLWNIIMDDEISNKKYSEEDKGIVRNMYLNGRVISGLVTEDHRKDWADMTVEQMYDKICSEIEILNKKIVTDKLHLTPAKIKNGAGNNDFIEDSILKSYIYRNIESKSIIKGDLKEFIDKGCWVLTPKGYRQWAEQYRNLTKKIYDGLSEINPEDITDDFIYDNLHAIANSSPIERADIVDTTSGAIIATVYTPEEKYIAVNVLNKYRSNYHIWYNRMKSYLNDHYIYNSDLKDLLQALE